MSDKGKSNQSIQEEELIGRYVIELQKEVQTKLAALLENPNTPESFKKLNS